VTSVTVSVTVLGPRLAQVKLVLDKVRLAMPQLSLLPLLICAGVIETWPAASSRTVMFRARATGASRS